MKRKIYEPVREFERATSYCPLYLAWRIVDEARDYFRTNLIPSSGSATFSHPMGEGQLARKLARRAEAVFAHHPSWAREATPRGPAGARQQFQCQRQRELILKFMRHWLAGVLARENPVLHRQLPESFKIGQELPAHSLTRPAPAGHPLPSDGRGKPGGAAAPPYQKLKTVGLTCRSAARHGSRGRSPHHRFVHGCELLTV
jgi:hypothetical protein